MRNFKIIVGSSSITHSIGNVTLKNFRTEQFWMKVTFDETWHHILFYDVSLGQKIGVWDPPLKGVKKWKIYIYDFKNPVLLKFWFQKQIFWNFFANYLPKNYLEKKNYPHFGYFWIFDLQLGPFKIKLFQIRKKNTKSAMKQFGYNQYLKCLA